VSFKVTQSPSRVKTALNCSYKYYCSYIKKIPSKGNDGTRLGDSAHIILESLANNKRKEYVSKILEKGDIFAIQSVKHLAYKLIHRHKLDHEIFIPKLKDCVLNGLQSDFYGLEYGEPIASYTEKDFLLEKEGMYKVRGFIDRMFVYKDGTVVIRDYKSSKSVYKGHEASTDNIQGADYSLAAREIIKEVEIKKIIVQFLFLQFDCSLESSWTKKIYRGKETKDWEHNGGGRIILEYSPEEISGFEYELQGYQNYLENFSEKSAEENFAANQEYPTDGSFGGPLSCGRAKKLGELKKDGSLMFHCEYKFPFLYWHVLDAENNFVISCFFEEREKLEEKYPPPFKWIEKQYSGCARFQKRG